MVSAVLRLRSKVAKRCWIRTCGTPRTAERGIETSGGGRERARLSRPGGSEFVGHAHADEIYIARTGAVFVANLAEAFEFQPQSKVFGDVPFATDPEGKRGRA